MSPITIPGWLNSTLAADATGGQGVLPLWIATLRPGQSVIGLAQTVRIGEGDNLGIAQAFIRGAGERTVLVAIGSPTSRRAVCGDIFAGALVNAGFRALVTDGLVRDIAELRKLELGIWARGTSPIGAAKIGPAGLDETVTCEEAVCSSGDLVIADDDGVVIWPAAHLEELLARAEERYRSDREKLDRVGRGELPFPPGV